MSDIGTVRREMKKAYKKAKNWRAVGAQFGVGPGMAWRIVKQDYEPHEAQIRVRLGLPAMVQAPACPICGKVHLKGHPRAIPYRGQAHRCAPTAGIGYWFEVPMAEIRRAFEERKEMRYVEE